MTEKQKEFLDLAVIQQIDYDEIEQKLGVERKTLSLWWDELKEPREQLSKLRSIWKSKCEELDFNSFRSWYENTPKQCYYCEIKDEDLATLWNKYPNLTKRKRGRILEIDRKEPNLKYDQTENLVFSCYWCNNAKTDTFTEEEFKQIGQLIKTIWQQRLHGN